MRQNLFSINFDHYKINVTQGKCQRKVDNDGSWNQNNFTSGKHGKTCYTFSLIIIYLKVHFKLASPLYQKIPEDVFQRIPF